MRIMDATMDSVMRKLERLAARIAAGDIGSAALWGGADVVISPTATEPRSGGFYPEPRQVVTPHAEALSWLFVEVRDSFISHYDGQSKIELFGRLANTAVRYQAKTHGEENITDLLNAVLHEAFAIGEEMEEGTFQSFAVAFDGEIVDDYIEEAERKGFIGIEETKRFFAERGIE
jgi:hypothetical protein